MTENKTVKQQVSELTSQQKKSIKKYEYIEGGIALIIAVPIMIYYLVAFFGLNNAREAYYETLDAFYEISTPEQDALDTKAYDDAALAMDVAQEKFNTAFVVLLVVAVTGIAIMKIVYFTVIKKKMPYYNVKVALYLLTHKTE